MIHEHTQTMVDTRLKHVRKQLVKVIRDAMEQQEMSQQELAKRSGLHTSSLSDIMNAKVNPKIETLARIEAGLGMNLFSIADEPQQFDVNF